MRNPQSLSPEDHERITQAVRAAEAKTSGEIFTVVAQASDDYFYLSGFFAALVALATGLALLVTGLLINEPLSAATIIAVQVFSLLLLLVGLRAFPHLRLLFVPLSVAHRRAANNARRQFLAHGIHATASRAGILIFVSLAEHYAEVIADAGIAEKVEQENWDRLVAVLIDAAQRGDLADGFVDAVQGAGALLATHFPPGHEVGNELDDRLVEI